MFGAQVQLGGTLKWRVEFFCEDVGEDLSPQFARIDEIASSLELAVRLYGPLVDVVPDAEPGAAPKRRRR